MKRPWSYDDDLDRGGGGGESSGRRFYLKLDERRRRVDHEVDGSGSGSGSSSGMGLAYDRRRGGLDKHRGSSFTAGFKRDFLPKGFRSERGDRHRRDGRGSASSWHRFGGGGDEELEPLSKASKTHSQELRENVRSRENCSSGERSSKLEEMKEEARKTSSNGSEMEEGELEPEPMQESVDEAKKSAIEEDAKVDRELGSMEDQSEATSEKKSPSSGDILENFRKESKDACPVEAERVSSEETRPERVSSEETRPDKVSSEETEPDKLSNEELTREGEGEGEGENKVELESSQKEDQLNISAKKPLHEDGKEESEREGKYAAVLVDNGNPKDDQMPTQTEQGGTNLPEQDGTNSPEKYPANLLCQTEEVVGENNCEDNTLNLLANKPSYREKGKGLAVDLDTEMEGSRWGGFDSIFRPEPGRNGGPDTKDANDNMKIDKLDLSLGLPVISLDCQNSRVRTESPPMTRVKSVQSLSRVRSVQSLPSASFTASASFSGSQFVHNPSCSLNQNSLENLEQSVKSRPLFQPVEQIINGVPTTIWQPKITDEVKHENGSVTKAPILQRNSSSLNKVATLARNSSFSSRLSSDEPSRDRRQLLKSDSQSFHNRAGVVEKVISKIVYEPLQLTGRMLQEMKENSVVYLKHAICEIVTSADKRSYVTALQESLLRRSDLTIETLPKCPRVLLEILLVLKTGRPDYIKRSSAVSTSDLVDIFLNNKCCNLDCRSVVPVDDCECKVCKNRPGFCSSCMCVLCANFDLASNTCSWVGCDICLHWCHTECGLHNLQIRPGGSESQMQFYCLACGHPSEMFGFVKEVFKTCAKEWKVEVLARELRFVRKIFGSSEDLWGRRLRDLVGQMLSRLEDGADRSEVVRFILGLFADAESNATKVPSTIVSQKEPPRILTKDVSWLPQTNVEKKPATDELDHLVKLKQAEAKLYQERSDDARKEAEGLRRIILAKSGRIDEEYSNRVAKLKLLELEQKQKRKQEELLALERAYKQFFSMKVRMETEIRDLMLKMDAAKGNFR